MTITSVRLQVTVRSKRKRQRLDRIYGGFEEWFVSRLEAMREQLRGAEAKGVNIVNFCLFEQIELSPKPNQWWRRMNTFEYDFAYDMGGLLDGEPIENLRTLMDTCSTLASSAPWPQVASLGAPLAAPFTREEKLQLATYLDWRQRKLIVLKRLSGRF